jgi:TetR/AcrR family transcriptional regulator, transcriptional repressor for nem operon
VVRQREFDTDEVLAIAMNLFWERGYTNTSMKDVVRATGVQPGSLYGAFGDKEKLFQQALRQYTQKFFRAAMPRNYPPLECIEQFFERLAGAMTTDPNQKGCLIINTAMEREAHSPSTIAIVEDRLDEIESFFCQNLHQAQSDGDLSAQFDVDVTAKALLGAVVGMLAISRMRRDRKTIKSIAIGAIALFTQS